MRYIPRVTTDRFGRKWIDGYLYMGRVMVPPRPPYIIMTDRTTGADKALSHTGSPGSLSLALIDPSTSWPNVSRFGPHEGPYIPKPFGSWRIYLDNGTLGVEDLPDQQYATARVLTRSGNQRVSIEITITPTGTITYTEIEL